MADVTLSKDEEFVLAVAKYLSLKPDEFYLDVVYGSKKTCIVVSHVEGFWGPGEEALT